MISGRRVRNLRGARRLLQPLRESGRRARPARLRRRDAGADRTVGPRLHRAPARRALAGRRRGHPRRSHLPPRRGPRAFGVGRTTCAATSSALRRASRVRGRARARPARRGRAALGTLRGRARFAVAGYVGGGRAALDAIAAARDDVLPGAPRATRLRATTNARGAAGRPMTSPPAYAECRRIARDSGPSFYAGIAAPRGRRDAIFAVYVLARRIDDIADGDLPPDEKPRPRADLGRSSPTHERRRSGPRWPSPTLRAATRSRSTRSRPRRGRRARVAGAGCATFADSSGYGRRVAARSAACRSPCSRDSTPPRPSRSPRPSASRSRSTNILRDVGEDARIGRADLPTEDPHPLGCARRRADRGGAERWSHSSAGALAPA